MGERNIQPELALTICPDGEEIDDSVEDDASCDNRSDRDVVSPVGKDQIER